MPSKKRRRRSPALEMNRRNKYKESPPDFELLASLYPSFRPYVSSSRSGRPIIDFTVFAATRELTRVLLLHDHGLNWWIPDGQLCPTVPNRSNYIHWIEDLLSSDLIPPFSESDKRVCGFDIGTGANCIYPLLGSSLLGWSFVGSDITDVALEWAKKNIESNPHISHLIEIRDANPSDDDVANSEPYVLAELVKEGERFDFCMCNPPFFESIEEAGLNPKTCFGGTHQEMVCPGGERSFVARIIEESVSLKHSFRWFTSMVGRKANLKYLASRAREVGSTVVQNTEFVQGQTARWGLAWSFLSPRTKSINAPGISANKNLSFMLQGVSRQGGAFQVLKLVESFFLGTGSLCKADVSSFSVNVTLSEEQTCTVPDGPSFSVSVFEQIPGTLLVRGSLLQKDNSISGVFLPLFSQLEETLRREILKK